jgi:mannose-1-phosphate guanylyltransferase
MTVIRDSDGQAGAIILAGGEGQGLAPLTSRIAGTGMPKQFSPMFGGETLLEQTLRRVALSIPAARTVTVLTAHHRLFFGPLLEGTPARNKAIQPVGRGTASAIVLGLFRLLELGYSGPVAIFPCDHYIGNETLFMQFVDKAIAAAQAHPRQVTLLGIPAYAPETQYGWIETDERADGDHTQAGRILRVSRFWEKPPLAMAQALWRRGCLWNTMIVVASMSALIDLFARATPKLYIAFAQARDTLHSARQGFALTELYQSIPSVDFSHSVLAEHASEMSVLPVPGVDWSDLGDPARVIGVIEKLGLRPHLAASA